MPQRDRSNQILKYSQKDYQEFLKMFSGRFLSYRSKRGHNQIRTHSYILGLTRLKSYFQYR